MSWPSPADVRRRRSSTTAARDCRRPASGSPRLVRTTAPDISRGSLSSRWRGRSPMPRFPRSAGSPRSSMIRRCPSSGRSRRRRRSPWATWRPEARPPATVLSTPLSPHCSSGWAGRTSGRSRAGLSTRCRTLWRRGRCPMGSTPSCATRCRWRRSPAGTSRLCTEAPCRRAPCREPRTGTSPRRTSRSCAPWPGASPSTSSSGRPRALGHVSLSVTADRGQGSEQP